MMRIFLSALVMLALSCSSPQHPRPWYEQAHIGINTTTHALAVADSVVAQRYTAEAHDAGSLDQLEQKYRPALIGLRSTLTSLLIAEHSVNVAQISQAPRDQCTASRAILEISASITDLVQGLTALGVAVPPELLASLPLLTHLALAAAPACTIDGGSL